MTSAAKYCPRCITSGKGSDPKWDKRHALRDCPLPPPTSAARTAAKADAPDAWKGAVEASQSRDEEDRRSKLSAAHAANDRKPEIDKPPTGDEGEPDWKKILTEAERTYGPGPFGLLQWQEERLVARDFPRMGDWWLWTIESFYASLKRWLLVMAGRGMGKSTVLTRVASAENPTVPRRIPPGQTWIWPFVSVRPTDAKRRLHEIKEIYSRGYGYALKISSPEGTPTMLLNDALSQSIAFVSFASTLGNVSGPNSTGATVDEEEKIEKDTAEIIGSLIGTFRARKGIRGIRCSSPMTTNGSLYKSIQEGDSITNFVARIGTRFLPSAVEGFLAVAEWEASNGNGGRGNPEGAALIRSYAAALTAETAAIPSWVGNPMYGATPGDGAVALRVEAEGVPQHKLEGLTRTRYWLREWGAWATDSLWTMPDDDAPLENCGLPSRYDGFDERRW